MNDPKIINKKCMCWSCQNARLDKPYLQAIMEDDPISLFIVCAKCGNKRCPHAQDHKYKCSNSNDVNQVSVIDNLKFKLRSNLPSTDRDILMGAIDNLSTVYDDIHDVDPDIFLDDPEELDHV